MIKIGFIGTGYRNHLSLKSKAYLLNQQCEIVALSNSSQGNYKSLIDKFDFPKSIHIYENYREMLANEDLDIIEISLPYNLHENVVEKSLKSNVVIVSLMSPFISSLGEAHRIVDNSEKFMSKIKIFNPLFYNKFILKAKELINKDYIGEVTSMRIKINLFGEEWKKRVDFWRNDSKEKFEIINNSLFEYPVLSDYGSQMLSLANWFFEEKIEKIFSWTGRYQDYDIPVYVMFKFTESKKHVVPQYGNLEISQSPCLKPHLNNNNLMDLFIEIIGSRGILKINLPVLDDVDKDSEVFNPLIIIRDGKIETFGDIETNWRENAFIEFSNKCVLFAKGDNNLNFFPRNVLEDSKLMFSAIKSAKKRSEVILD